MNKIKFIHELLLSGAGISTDTRKIDKGDVFFALKGDRFNGNEYAKAAIEAGAIVAIVDEEEYAIDDKYLYTDDVLKFLQDLARHHRLGFKGQLIALTGSNGKTTTKELIARVLKSSFTITTTQGNLNNHIGVPLSILRAKQDDDFVVIEMGANHQGEIALLCEIAQPDFGLITNIGKAHLEGFGGIEGVKKGKGEMYDYLITNKKIVFLNIEDSVLMGMIGNYQSFVEVKPSEIKIINDKQLLKISVLGHEVQTNLLGTVHAQNIANAITIGRYFGVTPDRIAEAIATYVPDNNRSEIVIRDSNTFILDAYNSNPTSVRCSLDAFERSSYNNKVIVLGDMLELGKETDYEHRALLELIESMNFQSLFLVGEIYFTLFGTKEYVFKTVQELKQSDRWKELSNSTILLKGSRALKLEYLAEGPS